MSVIQCSNCGASIDSGERACPYCGTAVASGSASVASTAPDSGSAPTVLSSFNQSVKFNSSAEAMDEIKRLLRDKNKVGAVKVHREFFGTDLVAAKNAVDQIETDLKFQDAPPPPPAIKPDDQVPAFAEPSAPRFEPAVSSTPFEEPKKPSNTRKWVIGCSIAAVLFLCLCVCLPVFFTTILPLLVAGSGSSSGY